MSQQNKSILSCRDITKSFGSFVALKQATFSLQAGEKVGLVGSNGTGKSTLLKIIARIMDADSGVVNIGKAYSVGYIPQSFGENEKQSVIDFLTNFSDINRSKLVTESRSLLEKLRLPESILDRYMAELSGGEKTKVALVRIFLSDHDLFLLDEPTNNLDMQALQVLEDFVMKSQKTFIIVSHDRMFLDRTVGKIISISEYTKEVVLYDGNFSNYLKQKEAERDREWRVYDDAIEKKEKMRRTIKQKSERVVRMGKTRSRDNDKMARNFKLEMGQRTFERDTRLMKERLENMGDIEKPTTLRPLTLSFQVVDRSGDKVFELSDVSKNLPTKLLGPINLSIRYGDRILLVGENGAGKSTLLKIILGHMAPDQGTVVRGTKLRIGYLSQEQVSDSAITVLELVQKESGVEESLARKTLNRFRLTEDDLKKKVSELSSGERSRLLIAIMMTQDPNCIILDEPSNHLDLEVLTELEQALAQFTGTLIVVSHDRYFIRKLHFHKVYLLDTTIAETLSHDDYENRASNTTVRQ